MEGSQPERVHLGSAKSRIRKLGMAVCGLGRKGPDSAALTDR
jgi:hypothetical protein